MGTHLSWLQRKGRNSAVNLVQLRWTGQYKKCFQYNYNVQITVGGIYKINQGIDSSSSLVRMEQSIIKVPKILHKYESVLSLVEILIRSLIGWNIRAVLSLIETI